MPLGSPACYDYDVNGQTANNACYHKKSSLLLRGQFSAAADDDVLQRILMMDAAFTMRAAAAPYGLSGSSTARRLLDAARSHAAAGSHASGYFTMRPESTFQRLMAPSMSTA